MKQLLILQVNQTYSLNIITELEDDDYIMNLYNTIFMIYLHNQTEADLVMRSFVGYDLYYFAEHIQQCIDNQLPILQNLEQSIDLGLLWNEHWQKIAIAENAGNPLSSWKWTEGNTLFLQCNSNGDRSNNTFLYNDDNGNIILQIASAYPWFFKEASSPDLDISYDDWLPQYKILYKTVVPKDVAQRWVKDLHGLYAMLELNT